MVYKRILHEVRTRMPASFKPESLLDFGSGLGSASAINNYIPGGLSILANPHSQLIRVIYESGFIGMLLYISIFIRPVKYLGKKLNLYKRHIQVLSLLVLSACFGHRSSACYIFLGILIAMDTYEKSYNNTV